MQDREMTTDLLGTEKKAGEDYNRFATEAAHPQVKEVFLGLLREEQGISHTLFSMMQTRGWYEVEEAPCEKREALKKQFEGCARACFGC